MFSAHMMVVFVLALCLTQLRCVDVTCDAARSGPGSADGAGDGVNVNGGRAVMVNGASKDDVVTPRRTTSSTVMPASAAAVNYPDNQQVFVGNLPQHLTDQDVIAFFERELITCSALVLYHSRLEVGLPHLFVISFPHFLYILPPNRCYVICLLYVFCK